MNPCNNLIYRGKSLYDDDWRYGALLSYIETTNGLTGKTKDVLINYLSSNNSIYIVQVEPESVGICINLTDKNNNLIYTGDILQVPENWDEYGFMSGAIREVYYCDGSFRLKPISNYQIKKGAKGCCLTQNDTKDFVILGNTFENPELLEKLR